MSIKFPVPKCKECNFHKHNSFLRGSHFCTFEATNKDEVMEWKHVHGRDMKTSPQWCPRRKEGKNGKEN